MNFYIFSSIFFPILISPLFFLLNLKASARHYLGFISGGIAFAAMLLVIIAGNTSEWNVPIISEAAWVPSLGINFLFITDGLSLFFGILITSVGVLVNLYAQFYMDPEDQSLGRFYALLTFFMGAMLGTVFSVNLMILFLFWELTGVASFLLVGYYHQEETVCKSAKTTLMVTSLTSLALFAGIILIGQLYGSFNWISMVDHIELFKSHEKLSTVIIICFLIGILGKSAQFPFFFWLPRAMIAPTPVSAYLHAATMVKLGIFLVARMYPLFVSNPVWFPAVSSICFATMLIGAALSLLSHDLKAILAYATISQLGFFIGFYGIGDDEGVQYDFIHILNHTFYKGSLFMLVGIVNHATGIRDIRRLGGLFKQLPFTAILFFISTAAMAGLPGTVGFLSKEMILADLVLLGRAHHSGWLLLGLLFTASLFKVAFSIRIFYHLFVRETKEKDLIVHPPGWAIEIPPAILSGCAFFFGIWPSGLNHLVNNFYVSGLHSDDPALIKIWHGWTIELLISFGIFLLGTLLFILAEKTQWRWEEVPKFLRLDQFYDQSVLAFQKGAAKATRLIHSKQTDSHLIWLFALLIGVAFWQLSPLLASGDFFSKKEDIDLLRVSIGSFVALFSLFVVRLKDPLSQLIALSASGFALTLYFALFKAPDLGMTQILVEIVTLILILIFFGSIKKHKPQTTTEPLFKRLMKTAVAVGMGSLAFLIVQLYPFMGHEEALKSFFLSATVPLAHGKNAVNTILVDFRGLDTLGEVSVLIIACLGSLGLLTNKLPFRFDFPGKETYAIPSIILKSVIPFIFFPVNLFAIYLFLRGHDSPGGGFAGGLCCAIAIILMGIVVRIRKRQYLVHIDPLRLAIFGLALVLLSGSISLLYSKPFLTHFFWQLGQEGNFLPATPLLFDLGIFLVVAGMAIKIVFFFRSYAKTSIG